MPRNQLAGRCSNKALAFHVGCIFFVCNHSRDVGTTLQNHWPGFACRLQILCYKLFSPPLVKSWMHFSPAVQATAAPLQRSGVSQQRHWTQLLHAFPQQVWPQPPQRFISVTNQNHHSQSVLRPLWTSGGGWEISSKLQHCISFCKICIWRAVEHFLPW